MGGKGKQREEGEALKVHCAGWRGRGRGHTWGGGLLRNEQFRPESSHDKMATAEPSPASSGLHKLHTPSTKTQTKC